MPSFFPFIDSGDVTSSFIGTLFDGFNTLVAGNEDNDFSRFLTTPFGSRDGLSLSSMFPIFAPLLGSDQADPSMSSVNTPAAVREADDVVRAEYGDMSDDWFSELFETAENAALKQAERNERSAVAAYERSEQAADNALKRARDFRQTAYQDAVASLKAAGLNPVLAAGGGISGSSTTAPMANAPASSSGMASGMNAADLLTAIAVIVSGAGNLMKGISSFLPSQVISTLLKG